MRVPSEGPAPARAGGAARPARAAAGLSRRRGPGFRGPPRGRFRILHTPAPTEFSVPPGTRAGTPRRFVFSPLRTRREVARFGIDGGADGQPFVATTPDHDADPGAPAARGVRGIPQARPGRRGCGRGRHERHRGLRSAPMTFGESPPSSRPPPPRPQLAPEAGGHRARDAAVRGRNSSSPRTARSFPARWPHGPINKPDGTVARRPCATSTQIRYIAPARRRSPARRQLRGGGPNAEPDGQPSCLRVAVTPVDARVTVLDFQPRSIQVVLDEVTTEEAPASDAVMRGGARRRRRRRGGKDQPTEVTLTGPERGGEPCRSRRASSRPSTAEDRLLMRGRGATGR